MSKDGSEPKRSEAKSETTVEQVRSPRAPSYLSGADAHLRHALRTPLNHIIGYSELLLDEVADQGLEEFAADLRNIRSAAKELQALMDDLFNPEAVDADSLSPALDMDTTPATEAPEESVSGDRDQGTDEVQKARLLVVDDDNNNREIVSRLLEREGYTVSLAEDGLQALEYLEGQRVDLILLDVMMPVLDGIEVCKRLKDDPETRLIPVVIMTALVQVEDRVRGIQAGADDFLTKPVNRDELLARIQTSLRLKQAVEHKLDRLKGAQEYLARFVPQSVMRELEENPESPALEKTDQDVSALFVDVTGYTKLSESMRQTADFMVEKYFSRYLDTFHAHGGDVTETSGDGLMVVFPGNDHKAHALNAVQAALEVLEKTEELNAQLEGIFDPVSVHIGINSGIALIGPTKYEGASGVRWTYTALGPPINLAARIASAAEGGEIYIGPETAARVEDALRLRQIGKMQFKNVKNEVMIHQVLRDT